MKQFSLARTSAATLLLLFALTGCQGDSGDDLRNAEPNELGITELKVERRTDGDDRFLEIAGLDANGEEIARATLRTGMVRYSYDPGADYSGDDAILAPGTELTISSGNTKQLYTSPDRLAHEVPIPPDAKLAMFAKLRAVAEEIDEESGIWFAAERVATTSDESPYIVSTCGGLQFPIDKGNPSQCCRNSYDFWHKIASGTNLNKLAYRQFYQNVCRNSNGTIGCVDQACYFGPCGGAVVGIGTAPNTTAAAVFYPTNGVQNCGVDSNGTAAGGYEISQAYNGTQTLYPGVTASCPWTGCRSNGYPSYDGPYGFNLMLTAQCIDPNSRGSVSWNGYSVACDGNGVDYATGYFWAPDAGYKIVSATPLGVVSGFMGWQGSCSGSSSCGGYWTSDQSITGTFFYTGSGGGGGGGCPPSGCP